MPIEAVTLDAAGTLIKPSVSVADIYCQIAARHGATLDRGALADAFAETFPNMPPMAFGPIPDDTLDARERAWWSELVHAVTTRAGGVPHFDAYFDELYSYFATGDAWATYPDVEPFLTALAERALKVAVVSNFDSRLNLVLAGLGLTDRVGPVLFSTQVGYAKPDSRIFAAAVDVLDVPAGNALHLGDNRVADFDGARTAGLRAAWLVRGQSAAVNEYVIRTLTDAIALLDGP